MPNNSDLLEKFYNAFDPFETLPPDDFRYVDCKDVRGSGDILQDLGRRISLANTNNYHIYSGHRGAGKSTELLRLKKYLEDKQFYTVYFAADEEDIDPQDAQYPDILLACTRRLLQDLQGIGNTHPLINWLKSLWGELKDLAQTPIEFEKMTLEMQVAQFAKLTANLRGVPELRQQIRQKINPHTVNLVKVLNEFLVDVKHNLPNGCKKLAVIVDNLDRMVLVQDGDRSNYEEIFLDRSEQLKSLDCHVIYTAPISLLYSQRGTDVRDIYSECSILPMIMVTTPNGAVHQPGLDKVKELIRKRFNQIAPKLSLEKDIFDHPDTLEKLCLMSGGHVRNLLLLIQSAIGKTEKLPITKDAVRISITQARDVYRRSVDHTQWKILAEVSRSKRIINSEPYRKLMYNRCLLEYLFIDDEGELQRWYNVHPLLQSVIEFKEAVAKLP